MSTFSFVFSFAGRDEYLAARLEWKTQYRALSQAQRDAKTSLKNAFRRNDVGAAYQGLYQVASYKAQARTLLDALAAAKEEAQRQYVARRNEQREFKKTTVSG